MLPLRCGKDLFPHGGRLGLRESATHRPAVAGLDAAGAELGGDVHEVRFSFFVVAGCFSSY
ncbi:MAG: hypothetical protein ACRDSK_11780 [Actinophytocola sp.]|uniref:hypothetical protein n=1 Tax=Actinophytocola sp. TaxID=1872138 RepID=UPI003D6A6DF1